MLLGREGRRACLAAAYSILDYSFQDLVSRVLERHSRCWNTSECAVLEAAHKSLTATCTPPMKQTMNNHEWNNNPTTNDEGALGFRFAQPGAPNVVVTLLGNLCPFVSLNF
jgi:hypothetical protein